MTDRIKPFPFSVEFVRRLLRYEPLTGDFFWRFLDPASDAEKRRNTLFSGKLAGSMRGDYLAIRINCRQHSAHRLAWFYMTGESPDVEVDHRNLITTDNSWDNLRLATPGQNKQNRKKLSCSTQPLKGVEEYKESGRWRARLRVGGKVTTLGTFDTAEEAHAVYAAAVNKLHGEFARTA